MSTLVMQERKLRKDWMIIYQNGAKKCQDHTGTGRMESKSPRKSGQKIKILLEGPFKRWRRTLKSHK